MRYFVRTLAAGTLTDIVETPFTIPVSASGFTKVHDGFWLTFDFFGWVVS
jgi:hypothetical protein